jgi:hypothetical protein
MGNLLLALVKRVIILTVWTHPTVFKLKMQINNGKQGPIFYGAN